MEEGLSPRAEPLVLRWNILPRVLRVLAWDLLLVQRYAKGMALAHWENDFSEGRREMGPAKLPTSEEKRGQEPCVRMVPDEGYNHLRAEILR